MFGIDPALLAFVILSAVSAASLAYAIFYNRIGVEEASKKRLLVIQRMETDGAEAKDSRERQTDATKRRKVLQDTLKELEARERDRQRFIRRPPIKEQIKQAGLTISIRQFYLYSVAAGVGLTLLVYFGGLPWWAIPAAAIVGLVGLPRWIVSFLRKRRVKAFLEEFPNALDIIVRAVKSGLPLNDGIRLIATESREPVKSEFRRIVEGQQLGFSIPEAALRMPETMPTPEAGFFGIVLQIQSQAGGNLSEALGNLSRVLRDRKKMKAKVAALSMEAKASAVIIGALPFVVAFLVYLTSPGYILPLFTTSTGHIILGLSGVWMAIGIFIMRQMINFEV